MNNKNTGKSTESINYGAVILSAFMAFYPGSAAHAGSKSAAPPKVKLGANIEDIYKKRCNGVLPEKAEVAIDAKTGEILVNHGGDKFGQLASLTKAVSAATIMEIMESKKGEVTPETPVKITPEILMLPNMQWTGKQQKDKQNKLLWGQDVYRGEWTVRDLMNGAALRSFNDFIAGLSVEVERKIDSANPSASALNLEKSFAQRATSLFQSRGFDYKQLNSSGLPHPGAGASLLTFSGMIKHIVERYPALSQIFGQKTAIIKEQTVENSNPLFDVPNSPYAVDFSKTGYICETGFMIGAKVTKGEQGSVIAVTKGAFTKEGSLRQYLDVLAEAYRVKAARASVIPLQKVEPLKFETLSIDFPKIEMPEIKLLDTLEPEKAQKEDEMPEGPVLAY